MSHSMADNHWHVFACGAAVCEFGSDQRSEYVTLAVESMECNTDCCGEIPLDLFL